jgi:riboflavin kinase/FMN adenylyltransferase
MQVVEWRQFLEDGLPCGKKLSSVTIGVFDGVHLGHRSLIEKVVSYNPDYAPVVITFRQNHKEKKHAQTDIQTFRQKTLVFESLGVKITLVIDFTESFRRMSGIEFLETLLNCCNIGFFAVGSNFRCGYGLDTDAAAIQKFFSGKNIPVEIVPEVMEGGLPISSSRIRSAIASGDFSLAEKMLGRPLST